MTLFMNLFDAPLAEDAEEVCATVSYNGYTGVPEETFTNTEGYILVSESEVILPSAGCRPAHGQQQPRELLQNKERVDR